MKNLGISRNISRILVGVVFVFSGFVKEIDPLGSTYKFTDYFNAFGMEFMTFLAFPLAVMLASAELLIGISLFLGYRMKVTSWAVLLFMSFFTILTFILALTNPVTDCGCFGDALILTNWQTFGKNIILMFFVILIFRARNKYPVISGPKVEYPVLAIFFIAAVFISVYCLNHLPLLDFMPYSKGVNIPAGMIVPENAPLDVYETKLYYKNKISGKQEIFDIQNIPDDSLWEFSSSESKIISRGYETPIHDFNIVSPGGQEITNLVLENPGYTFLLVAYNLNKAEKDGLIKADKLNKIAQSLNNFDFYALSASIDSDIEKIKSDLKLSYNFYSVDEIVLKTMIRSNPGLILIKNGTILGKWSCKDFPGPAELGQEFEKLSSTIFPSSQINNENSLTKQAISNPEKYEAAILSYLMRSEKMRSEKNTIYLCVLGFIVFALIIRIFLEEPFLKSK
jgi:uncharacterized membrane protein YphA (DoxX/SURF4 family)